ncbi:HEAT repeat domain-containing protein [Gloeothece verrucosa]|uniref:Putative signal transduction protein with Nacht domain n=1 Tax=Gloeothece verrucosa (strain PCC 7822) TaxID=497965 RepID=E0UC73_GLOV7|nr:HEAT repeat domain-containing protein [Gloeothece verrucosa]ADN12830.1 putative signal transduction protein with Nacht domain [Gloeothece verrucosa PCC 7822]
MMTQQGSEQQATLVSPQKLNIDWQQVCQAIWKNSVPINPLTTQPKETEAQWEKIHLSLGLIKHKKNKFNGGNLLDGPNYGQGYSLGETHQQRENPEQSEIVQIYNEKEFCQQILCQQKSAKAGQRIAIIGESSSGKTVLLHQITAWILDNTQDLPIWISMAELGETPLYEYLQQKWLKRVAKTQDELTRQWQNSLDELLKSGRVWLLLDGVEQMPLEQLEKLPVTVNSQTRGLIHDPLSETLQQLEGWADETRVILTSRDDVLINKNTLSHYQVFRPLELTYPEQVKPFINQWFAQNTVSKTPSSAKKHRSQNLAKLAEQLVLSLEEFGYYRIQDLLQTPLRLSLLCRETLQNRAKLPATTAQIFDKIVHQYYQWQAETVPLNAQQQQELNQALGKLALCALDNPHHPHWLYHHQITETLGDEELLLQLALRLGWLRPIGITANATKEKVYSFSDHKLQAYLAATLIEDWQFFLNHPLGSISSLPSTPCGSSYRIFAPQWKPVIKLWIGREEIKPEDKEAFLQGLVQFADGCETDNYYGKRAYFLAASALAEFPDGEQTNAILLQLLQWCFFDAQISPLIAQAAKAALRETHRKLAIPALIQLLTTIKNESIKREIFKTLEKIGQGNAECIAALKEMLASNSAFPMRWQVAETLGKIDPGNSEAIATIVNILETANHEESRQIAFKSLEKIGKGNFKAITTLKQVITTTHSAISRRRAFETLETIGYQNATAIAALVQLIRTNSDQGIRCSSAESLEKIDPGNPTAITVLVQLVKGANNEEIQKQAVYSLGEISPGNPQAISVLGKMLSPNYDVFLRWMAISSLGKIGNGNSEAISALVNLIKSDERLLRKDAIESLSKIDPHNEEVITALVRLIDSEQDESIRREAAENLGKIPSPNFSAKEALLKLLRTSSDEFTRHQAAESLAKIEPGNLEALKTLIDLVQGSIDANVRSIAAESLGDIGQKNPAVIALLVRVLKTTNEPKILDRAALSLGKIGLKNREVISTLVMLVKSCQDETCRLQAAESVINLLKVEQMSEVIANLKENLSDPHKRKDLACQKIIWHCAQKLSYPEFYQAWHNRPLYGTQKVTKAELNLNEESPEDNHFKLTCQSLSQLLQAKIDEHSQLSQSIRPIFIDSNNLFDPINPLVDIYDLMLAQNCPPFEHGIPDTMAKLRLYWNSIQRDENNANFVLIFYDHVTPSDSQGFSPEFLKMLSKFGGAICLVTEKLSSNLQQFSPTDPQLIENIITWIETQK